MMKFSRLPIQTQFLSIALVGAVASVFTGAIVDNRSAHAELASQAPTTASTRLPMQIAAEPVRVGQSAPNFTAKDSNGKTHQLSDFKSKTVVLEWTNHQCPFVRKHYESKNMQKLQKQTTAKGVVWLSVVSSAPGNQGFVDNNKANELSKSRGAAPSAVLIDADGKLGQLYSARTTPHMFVIAPNGTLAYMGAIDSNSSSNPADVATAKNYVAAAVDAVSKGQKMDPATTQPYGCSVKYK
jgi:peroxiredoxin